MRRRSGGSASISDGESCSPSRLQSAVSELEEVDGRVGSNVRSGPEELACTSRSTVHASSDCVKLGHVLVGAGHELDLHALPGLVGGGVPLDEKW